MMFTAKPIFAQPVIEYNNCFMYIFSYFLVFIKHPPIIQPQIFDRTMTLFSIFLWSHT